MKSNHKDQSSTSFFSFKVYTLIALFVASTLFSEKAFAINLIETYREALQNDSKYASARAEFTAGQEKRIQGRALLLPVISITGKNMLANTDYSSENTSIDGIKTSDGKYALQLTQPLFRWENWQRYELGKLQTLVSEARFRQAQLDLMGRVAQAYFDVLHAQDSLEAARANTVAFSDQLRFATSNLEAGTNTITDNEEAQARHSLALADEFAAESDLEIKRSALQQIIGHEPDALSPLNKEVQLTAPEPADIKEWVNAAEKNNYGVVAAQVEQEIAKRSISLNRAGHLPTVDLVATVSRSMSSAVPVQNLSGYQENSRSIAIQLNVPLFSGFAVTSKVREAIALEDKAANDVESTKRNAALQARQAFLGISRSLAQTSSYTAAKIASQSAVESTRMGYHAGVRIITDLLNAQQQLYVTQQQLSRVRYDIILHGLRLKWAAGSLKEEDLVRVNGLLR
jgi:outer membrane protein